MMLRTDHRTHYKAMVALVTTKAFHTEVQTMKDEVNDNIIMYDVNKIRDIFQFGKNNAYQLMKANGFPSIKIGGKMLVEKTALEKWLMKNQGKSIIIG